MMFARLSVRLRWLCAAAVVVAAGTGPLWADAVDVAVLKQTADRVVLGYTIADPTMSRVDIGGQAYVELALGKEALRMEAGAPALPRICRSVAIPDTGAVTVRVLQADYHDVQGVAVAPSKGSILRSIDPKDVPYTFGRAYETNAFFPGEIASVREPYILRSYRGVVVEVNPCQYNPATQTLRVYNQIVLEVVTEGIGGVNELAPNQIKTDASFHMIYKNQFVNLEQRGLRYSPLDEEGGMLIIAHDAWISNVSPLADHKTSIGIPATVVGVSTIGNNATSIKNYIQTVYDTSDLAFVLLVGDAQQVATPIVSGGASDPTYSKLAGNDNYPDIMVGRFSAQTAAQVDTQVERTIEYENLPATQQDWFWRGTGIASNQGPGDDGEYDNQHIDNLRVLLLAYGYTLVDQIYDPYGTAAMVTNALNAGRGIVNYCGHGWPQGWSSTGFSNSHVNALQNDNMLPFITSVACNTGEFNNYDACFGEAWLRATHNGQPTGAVGFYGSSISQYWNEPMQMQDEYIALYTTETYVRYGTLCFAGSCSMMDQYGSSGVTMFNTWILFGDPSLRVVGTVAPPTGMKVSPSAGLNSEGPNGGPFTPNSIVYTLTNFDPVPLQYSVSHSAQWVTVTNPAGTIPVGGQVYVTVSINNVANGLPNGNYEDMVYFVNETSHVGDTTRKVTLKVGVPTLVYLFNLDQNPGWSMQGEWQFGRPTGQGGYSHGFPDPNSGYTGLNVYGINLNGDYSIAVGGPYYLTTGAIDCSNLTEVSLRFRRWLNTDYQPYVYATIDVSKDGTNWVAVWNNGSSEIAENSWSQQIYDISAVANNQPTVYIRWGHRIGSTGAWAYSGWNIDDIEIWGLVPGGQSHPLGDLNCDDAVDGFDIQPFVLAMTDPAAYASQYPDCDYMLADVNGDGTVDGYDIQPFVELLTGK